MSTIKVDNIRVTGESVNRPVTGVAAAYCSVNQTSTQSINDSLNVSTVADTGEGSTSVSYTSHMKRDSYGFTCGKGRTEGQNGGVIAMSNAQAPTASLIRIMAFQEINTTIDEARANIAINGDLA
jgi:hypothetical protein